MPCQLDAPTVQLPRSIRGVEEQFTYRGAACAGKRQRFLGAAAALPGPDDDEEVSGGGEKAIAFGVRRVGVSSDDVRPRRQAGVPLEYVHVRRGPIRGEVAY